MFCRTLVLLVSDRDIGPRSLKKITLMAINFEIKDFKNIFHLHYQRIYFFALTQKSNKKSLRYR